MKKAIFILILIISLVIVVPSTVMAATSSNKLPSRFTYAKEWLYLHVWTLKSDSKIGVLDQLISTRTENIKIAVETQKIDQIDNFAERYQNLKDRQNKIIENKSIPQTTIDSVVENEINRQRILSQVRQEVAVESVKKEVAAIQEQAVSSTKDILEIKDINQSKQFQEKIVDVWRDPNQTVAASDEKNTRIYVAGTTIENIKNQEVVGVVIDGGQAKIDIAPGGDLKIEYAPGTGPNSIVSDNGQRKWKIQQSDGTVIENYLAAGQVVVGQTSNTVGNVIVNTVAGGTTNTPQTVVGGGDSSAVKKVEGNNPGVVGGSEGTGNVKVEGSNSNTIDSSGSSNVQVEE